MAASSTHSPVNDEALQQAALHHQAGRFPAAESLYRTILQTDANHPQANHNLGTLLLQAGHMGAGLAHLKLALDTAPSIGQYWLSYAHALLVARRPHEALHVLQAAIQRGLNTPDAHALLASATSMVAAGGAQPTPADDAHIDALLRTGRHAELETQAGALLERYPESGFTWNALGFALLLQGKNAVKALQRAAELMPDDADVLNNLGNAQQLAGQVVAAAQSFSRALQFRPAFADAHNNLGNVLRDLGRMNEAAASYRQALQLKPDFAQAHNNLGNTLRDLGRLDDALTSIRTALKIKPDHATAHNNLGYVLMDLGQYADAIASFRQALAIKPDYFEAHSNLLFAHNLLTDASPTEALADARHFGELVAKQAPPAAALPYTPDPARCLRVGLVSGDLHAHPVGYFVESTLKALSCSATKRMEVFVYSNHPSADALTERIKTNCQGWFVTTGVPDLALAQRIRDDGIDILIDLSGHTARNRLPVFAHRPAPVQASWLGYFATTGVAAIDYLIADPWTLPPAQEVHFTEQIWRLPHTRLCFTPPDVDVAVSALPALAGQGITFGCFNNLVKINDGVVALWAKVLRGVPGSRLFLKAKQLQETSVRQAIVNRFANHGVASERLILEGHEPRAAYLAAYHRVDIALDPFPYPGGATTAEALWMGVPVLTLAGENFLSRQGVGLMVNAGLPDWVAPDADGYLARAIAHSSDLNALSALRGTLRNQVLASPVFDAQQFGRQFGEALRSLWVLWCDAKKAQELHRG